MPNKMKNVVLNEQGAIVVEATISLTAFMFLIVTILTVINICYAQAKIGVAVNTTAKEISEYSYLYNLTGLREKQGDLYSEGEDAKKTIDETLDGVVSVFNSVEGISDTATGITIDNIGDSFEGIQGNINDIDSSVDSIQSNIDSIMEDPQSFALSVAALAGNEAIEEVKSKVIAGPFAKLLCQKHLVTENCSTSAETKQNCNEFLKKLGIMPKGNSYIDGLDFSDSVLFLNGSTDIMVIVHYRLKVIKLLDNDITLSFTQCATTRGWVPISGKSDNSDSLDEDTEDNTDETTESTEPTTPKKTAEEYVNDFIISPDSAEAFIGITTESDKADAQYYSGSYMIVDSAMYSQIKENIGSDGVSQVYKAYIDDRLNNGSRIVCSSNPENATDVYFRQQVKYLKQKGYTFRYNESTGLYIAEKA